MQSSNPVTALSNGRTDWDYLLVFYSVGNGNGTSYNWLVLTDLSEIEPGVLGGENILASSFIPGNTSNIRWWSTQVTWTYNPTTDDGGDTGGGNPNDPTETPEPGTILLLGTGIIGLGIIAKRKMGKK